MFKNLAAAVSFATMALTATLSWAENSPMLVDVLTLNEGKTYEDAQGYFDKVIPIIETHGIKRVRVLEVQNKMQGHPDVTPNIVQLWELEIADPFSGIFSDPNYLLHVPLRDSIFNMSQTQFWMTTDR
ncbi:hypothetical protein GFB49_17640 [Epibacterium sp. SM1979]|uniref:DUF1330 domain-containing protein n=1 Tax=Tritonibacter litoralis TaxID=2662264 RepID=A0A843YLJ8_9RHOB|nr:hypothetical protein [Tritonibacter litoralis]MQQ10294.1 hypothetical protein [Tritonibacter litoralis]